MTMSEKRIMSTWVFGEAWDRFCSNAYLAFRQKAFLMCGTMITVNGINDNQIQVVNYTGPVEWIPPGSMFTDLDYVAECLLVSLINVYIYRFGCLYINRYIYIYIYKQVF